MAKAFVDTSGWIEFFVESKPFHALALLQMDVWQAEARDIVTTNYIVAELVSLLANRSRVARSERDHIIDTIRSASWVEVVHLTPELDRRAWELLKRRSDKEWSLVDAASFIVMGDLGITDALTTDHHFAQAGFVRLLG